MLDVSGGQNETFAEYPHKGAWQGTTEALEKPGATLYPPEYVGNIH